MDTTDVKFLEYYRPILNKSKPITKEEEIELGKKIVHGNPDEQQEARDSLVESHLRFAFGHAMRKYNRAFSYTFRVQLADVVQLANEGLIIAADRFEYQKDNRFMTYATFYMKTRVDRGFREYDPVHCPDDYFRNMQKLFKLKAQFKEINDRAPTVDELSEAMGFTKEKIQVLLRPLVYDSLDQDHGSNGDSSKARARRVEQRVEYVLASRRSNLLGIEDLISIDRVVDGALSRLKPVQQEVLRLHYGFDDNALFFSEVGQRLGVSKQRVHQIERDALKKLRKMRQIKELKTVVVSE